MAMNRERLYRETAARGKYAPLYRHLCALVEAGETEWRTRFSEIEAILRFELPSSARKWFAWWANQKQGGSHSHALAWQAAGWRTREVDLGDETLVFVRPGDRTVERATIGRRTFSIDEVLPPHDPGSWPAGFTLGREQVYGEDAR